MSSIDVKGYFECLRASLNKSYYVTEGFDGKITLKEKIYIGASKKEEHIVPLKYSGEAFFVKLDKKNSRQRHEPLFHFLEEASKPWASRCDFVIFHLFSRKINIYCIEFKSGNIGAPEKQLGAGEAWCKSLQDTINNYMGYKKSMVLRKYVFTKHTNPSPHLDASNNLRADPSIRHFLYDEVKNMDLSELTNKISITIK